MPRMRKIGNALVFEDASLTLAELGSSLGILPKLSMFSSKWKDVPDLGSELDNKKRQRLAEIALSAISPRRYAKDFSTARDHLGYAQANIEKIEDCIVSDELLCDFHAQWALSVILPELNDAADSIKSEVELILSNTDVQLSDNFYTMYEKLGRLRTEIKKEIVEVRQWALRAAAHSQTGPRVNSAPGVNLDTLQGLAYVQSMRYCAELTDYVPEFRDSLSIAKREASGCIERLTASLNGFSDAEGYAKDPEWAGPLGRKGYQHCRNIYLLLVESFLIAKKQGDVDAARQFISKSLAICKRGSSFIDHYTNALSSTERLEMARSVWIAALRNVVNDEGSYDDLELGYVCGLMTSLYRQGAKVLMSDKAAMKNAVAFLATTNTTSVIEAALSIPLLPSNELILADAETALELLDLKSLIDQGSPTS